MVPPKDLFCTIPKYGSPPKTAVVKKNAHVKLNMGKIEETKDHSLKTGESFSSVSSRFWSTGREVEGGLTSSIQKSKSEVNKQASQKSEVNVNKFDGFELKTSQLITDQKHVSPTHLGKSNVKLQSEMEKRLEWL